MNQMMLPVRMRRLISEIEEVKWMIETKQLEPVEILEQDEFNHVVLLFSGAIDSPYEGFWFRIRIEWPEGYPFQPPKCILKDKIWNPYVDFKTNELCIDILKNQHSPALRLIHHILSIISLLSQTKIDKDLESFMNPDAAFQISRNYPYFFEHARKHCETFSYKKKVIYSNQMRGLPEEHYVSIQSSQISALISANQNSNSFKKKLMESKEYEMEEENQHIKNHYQRLKERVKQENEILKKMTSEEIKTEIENYRNKIQTNLLTRNSIRSID